MGNKKLPYTEMTANYQKICPDKTNKTYPQLSFPFLTPKNVHDHSNISTRKGNRKVEMERENGLNLLKLKSVSPTCFTITDYHITTRLVFSSEPFPGP